MALVTGISRVDKIRQLEGCDRLIPLKAVIEVDKVQIIDMLNRLEIPLENRMIHTDEDADVTQKEINASYRKICSAARKCSYEEKTLFLFVFSGGHGVGFEQKQVILLNSNIAKTAIYHIELKLRQLADKERSLRSIAIFDCCSVSIFKYEALADEVGWRGINEGCIKDPSDSDDETGQHWQLITAKPGGVADANSGNAERINKWFKKFAKQYPVDYISVPHQVSEIKGGTISTGGGKEYFIKFLSQEFLNS